MPLFYTFWLACSEINSLGAKVGRATLLWGTGKDLFAPGDLKIDEASHNYRMLKLYIQQSTGNSTRPENDFVFGSERHLFFDQNVGNLQASTGL